ncbi:uncharacterized protein BDZ99DRAFT_573477 [Mytilinidion resinicola]|uniref:Uncharacterized protein n=1 Tax=Mytilinidion resinicola TaxID=574789 RepID=A0A6A6YFT1_9PEZI|nr:uncharacterized protein BDZ99DRAFT_573477 [Mytilinidion resinicola]KAF2806747.1 hypothetical protein BDZ99DRAFT_573477 [Mytilinidion resinicola]
MDFELAHLIEKGWRIPDGELQKLWTPSPMAATRPTWSHENEQVSNALILSRRRHALLIWHDVLCVDHPGGPPYLKIPYGGGGVYGIPIDYDWAIDTLLYKVNRNRKTDFDALLQLYPPLVEEFRAPFNISTYMHFGFSMGGSVDTDIVSRHDDVIPGINYDGAFIDILFGETVDVKKPFFSLCDGQHEYDDTVYGYS